MHGTRIFNPHPLENIPASFPSGYRWYVFSTYPRKEKEAEKAVRDLGFSVFIPFEKKIRRRPGRKPMPYERAYFPCYGFAHFDINDKRWALIRKADGVLDVLRSVDGIPVAVRDSAIDELHLAESMGILDQTKPPKAGIEVEVMEGPFSTLMGKVLRARSGDRADILFKGILGAERMVTLPLSFLRER